MRIVSLLLQMFIRWMLLFEITNLKNGLTYGCVFVLYGSFLSAVLTSDELYHIQTLLYFFHSFRVPTLLQLLKSVIFIILFISYFYYFVHLLLFLHHFIVQCPLSVGGTIEIYLIVWQAGWLCIVCTRCCVKNLMFLFLANCCLSSKCVQ